MRSYGKQLSEARLASGLTQAELAKAISVTRETLSRWERDTLKYTPPADELRRLVLVLDGLTEIALLAALGYDLGPLVDDGKLKGRGPGRGDWLTRDEARLVESFRRLPPILRRVVLRQVEATASPPEGRPGSD